MTVRCDKIPAPGITKYYAKNAHFRAKSRKIMNYGSALQERRQIRGRAVKN